MFSLRRTIIKYDYVIVKGTIGAEISSQQEVFILNVNFILLYNIKMCVRLKYRETKDTAMV